MTNSGILEDKRLIIGIVCYSIKAAEANLLTISYPNEVNQTAIDESKHDYPFTPVATIIGLVFIAISFSFLAIAKILYASSDQYMMNNRFDLVIFKPPTNKSVLGPRRIYTNTITHSHNLAAAQACGFDVSMLNTRNPYSTLMKNKDLNQKEAPNSSNSTAKIE